MDARKAKEDKFIKSHKNKTEYMRKTLTDIQFKHESSRIAVDAPHLEKGAIAMRASYVANLRSRQQKKAKEAAAAAAKSKQKANKVKPPPLKPLVLPPEEKPRAFSMTKMDFEMLREYKWREREKRLETWKDVMGLPMKKGRRHTASPLERSDTPSSDEEKILQKEMETLTGYHVITPQESYRLKRKAREAQKELDEETAMSKRSLDPNSAFALKQKSILSQGGRMSDERDVHAPTHFHGHHGAGRKSSFASGKESRNERQLMRIGKQLEKIVDKARVAQLAKSFGKGWNKQQDLRKMSSKDHNQSQRPKRFSSVGSEDSSSNNKKSHRKHHHKHRHHHHHHHRTDVEEEQIDTMASGSATTLATSPTGTPPSEAIDIDTLFREIREGRDKKKDNRDQQPQQQAQPRKDREQKSPREKEGRSKAGAGSAKSGAGEAEGDDVDESDNSDTSEIPRFKRKKPGIDAGSMKFKGGLMFIDRSQVEPMSKAPKDQEFYLSFDDTQLGLGLGKTQQVKIKFFKPTSTGKGHGEKVLAKLAEEEREAAQEKHERELEEKAATQEQQEQLEAEKERVAVVDEFMQISNLLKTDMTTEERIKYAEKFAEFEKALMQLPNVGPKWKIEVTTSSKPPPKGPDGQKEQDPAKKAPRRNMFTRPSERVWYTPIPLTIKKYYRTNWKKIRHDVRKQMREWNYWPKMWINFEENHPKQLYELIQAKMTLKEFGFKKAFDWEKGFHPDYIDWVLDDIVPHQGRYYYDKDVDYDDPEPVRRASLEEKDIKLKDWFVKPPRYIPASPVSPPFDMFNFCGYGDREKPYFLHFTLPREILHYYAPPSNIERFFRTIPKPPYAFPGFTFKRWLKYPLDQKLPQYYPFPKQFSFWTMGKIGERVQCLSTEFRVDDPRMVKRKWTYSPYQDPHTRHYVLRKDVLDRIWALGLVNSKGEVRCSMKEFNQHRIFLRDYEWLEECLRRWNSKWTDREQHNMLTKEINIDDMDFEAKNLAWRGRLERCRRNLRRRAEEELIRFKKWQKKAKEQVEAAYERKRQQHVELMEEAQKRQESHHRRRMAAFRMERDKQEFTKMVHYTRLERAEEQRRVYFLEKIADRMKRQREVFKRHLEYHERRVNEVKWMQEVLDLERKERARKHRARCHHAWKDIPYAIIRRKIRDERDLILARKYFYIWLEKTRAKKTEGPDEAHKSLWGYGVNEHHLHHTVYYLKQESGQQNFNNLAQNILQYVRRSKEEERKRSDMERRNNTAVGEDEEEEMRKGAPFVNIFINEDDMEKRDVQNFVADDVADGDDDDDDMDDVVSIASNFKDDDDDAEEDGYEGDGED